MNAWNKNSISTPLVMLTLSASWPFKAGSLSLSIVESRKFSSFAVPTSILLQTLIDQMDYKKQMLPTQCTFAAPYGAPFNLTIAFSIVAKEQRRWRRLSSFCYRQFGIGEQKMGKQVNGFKNEFLLVFAFFSLSPFAWCIFHLSK